MSSAVLLTPETTTLHTRNHNFAPSKAALCETHSKASLLASPSQSPPTPSHWRVSKEGKANTKYYTKSRMLNPFILHEIKGKDVRDCRGAANKNHIPLNVEFLSIAVLCPSMWINSLADA